MKQLFVIKIGGNVIDDAQKLQSFLKDFSTIDAPKILVHGGGKIATRIGEQLGIESKYIDGRRITDDATIDLVTMVYGGLVNKKIVAELQACNCNAIGLTGADGNIIPAKKRPLKNDIDYGWAGDIIGEKINIALLKTLLKQAVVPVFAPLTHTGTGKILNTNADTIAASLAVALSEAFDVRLIYCFEKKGVLENIADENSVIKQITQASFTELKAASILYLGILPKIENALSAIDAGVSTVLIGHADDLLQNCTDNMAGTLIL